MELFSSLVGKWRTESVARPSAESKEGHTATGEAIGQWLHNGHFLRLEGSIDSTPDRTEYTMLLSYDRNRKTYRRWAFTSAGVAAESVGSWDEATATMTWTGTQGNVTTLVKQKLEKDRFVETHLFKRDDGAVLRDLTFTAQRKKPADDATEKTGGPPAGFKGVSAVGAVEPAEVFDVGAQVTGRIEKLLVDYGTFVRAGEVLAQINPEPYEIEVDRAKAGVERADARFQLAKAKLTLARRQLERLLKLRDAKAVDESEIDTAKAELEVAEAMLRLEEAGIAGSKAALKRAMLDLSYCTIRSPVEGLVLERTCHVGQAVAARLDAPSLFMVAKDLKALRVVASVKEADIARVAEGQAVEFEVDALPEKTFKGRVAQIRFSAQSSKLDVTFKVVIDVERSEAKLLPHMTAHVRILVGERP
jgi:RND family efflux transporter MFP subunit